MKRVLSIFVILFLALPIFAFDLLKSDVEYIENTISKNYVAFDEWIEKGYNHDIIGISNTDELNVILHKYVDDRHFSIKITRNKNYYHFKQDHYCFCPNFDIDTSHIEDNKKFYYPAKNNLGQEYVYADFILSSELNYSPYPSTFTDRYGYHELIVGNNDTFYIRIPDCDAQNINNGYVNMGRAARKACKCSNIILDLHNNSGGGIGPQIDFLTNLINVGYKGTIYVIQDYNSQSAAESWWFMTEEGYTKKLNCVLVGTNSGGCKRIAQARMFFNKDKSISLNLPQERYIMSDEFHGEGWGYFPQIWSLMVDLPKTFEALGVNVDGIDFFKCEQIKVIFKKDYENTEYKQYHYYYTRNTKAGDIIGYGIALSKIDNIVYIGNLEQMSSGGYRGLWGDPYKIVKKINEETFNKLKSFFEDENTYKKSFEEQNSISALIESIYNE